MRLTTYRAVSAVSYFVAFFAFSIALYGFWLTCSGQIDFLISVGEPVTCVRLGDILRRSVETVFGTPSSPIVKVES